MTLKLEDKKAIVEELHDIALKAVSAIIADYRGLNVAEMTDLRVKARELDVYIRVIRNTLAKRALAATSFACLQDLLEGPTFLAFSLKEPSAAARLVRSYSKEHDNLKAKALSLGGKVIAAKDIGIVADLPTYDQAIAMMMGVMLANVTKFVRTLAEPYAKLTRTIAAVGEQKKSA